LLRQRDPGQNASPQTPLCVRGGGQACWPAAARKADAVRRVQLLLRRRVSPRGAMSAAVATHSGAPLCCHTAGKWSWCRVEAARCTAAFRSGGVTGARLALVADVSEMLVRARARSPACMFSLALLVSEAARPGAAAAGHCRALRPRRAAWEPPRATHAAVAAGSGAPGCPHVGGPVPPSVCVSHGA
jgi:hypothetical protein